MIYVILNYFRVLLRVCNTFFWGHLYKMKLNHLKIGRWYGKKVILSYPASWAYNHHAAVGSVNGRCSWQLPSANRNEKDVWDCQNLNVLKFDCIINWTRDRITKFNAYLYCTLFVIVFPTAAYDFSIVRSNVSNITISIIFYTNGSKRSLLYCLKASWQW